MLALTLVIVSDACWIALDVWACIVTYPTLPPNDWYFLVIGGAVLVLLTIVAGSLQCREYLNEKRLRLRREWSRPTAKQSARCISIIGRTGQEEFGERKVRFLRDPLPDCIYVTDELELIFREAGYEVSNADIGEDKTVIRPGIWIQSPEGHPGLKVTMRGLAEIFGEFNVHHRSVSRVLPAVLDKAMTLFILIGRKPIQHVS
jgi:hypothetical protein